MSGERFVVAADHVVTIEGPVLSPGFVVIADGLIEDLASGPPPDDRGPVENYGRAALLPGFVNAHTHLGCAFLQGEADDSDFMEWLTGDVAPRVIATVRDAPDVLAAAARCAAEELARGGVTTVADSFFHPAGAEALVDVGLRGRFHGEVFGSMAEDLDAYAARAIAELEASSAPGPLVDFGVAPHAPYTCPRDVLVAVDAAARRLGMRSTVHVAESREELAFFRDATGPMHERFTANGRSSRYALGETPIAMLDELGLLRPDVMLVHAVHITQADIETIASSGSPVIHCPTSNHRLAVGVAPIFELLRAGVDVALGTDSHASSGKLDMFEEMRLAVLSQRVRYGTSAALDARTALEMATLAGARAMGLDDRIGSLTPGKAADMMVVDLSGPATRRVADPESAVVWSATPAEVAATWVEGRKVARRGRP